MVNPRSMENLKPFDKGVSGNPNGRPKGKSPAELNELKGQTKHEVVDAIHRSLMMNMEELKNALQDPQATVAQQLVGRIIMKALKDGCFQRAQFLLNYVLGRPKTFENDDNSAPDMATPQAVLTGVPTNVLIELMAKHKTSG